MSVATITARHPSSIARRAVAAVRTGSPQGTVATASSRVVVGAERRHRPVQRRSAAVQEVEVAPGELRGGERREHELRRESQLVHHERPLRRIERTDCTPTLRAQQLLGVGVDRGHSPGSTARGLFDGSVGERPGATEGERPQRIGGRGVGELLEPTGKFHHMAVGVEDDTVTYVRHAGTVLGDPGSDHRWDAPCHALGDDPRTDRYLRGVPSAIPCNSPKTRVRGGRRTNIRCAGIDGEELAIDVAVIGPDDAESVLLIVVSGTHGVEGFTGSALQHHWFRHHAGQRPSRRCASSLSMR
jgi:hypothetical protein